MDTQTRHALKQDRLVEATKTSVDWFQENRSRVITAGVAAVICLAIVVAGLVLYGKRSAAADLAFGEAMDTYDAPLAQPGQPPTPGQKTFATAAERAKLANQQFAQVADQYGLFKAGKTATVLRGNHGDRPGPDRSCGNLPAEGRRWARCRFSVAGQTSLGQPVPTDQPQ